MAAGREGLGPLPLTSVLLSLLPPFTTDQIPSSTGGLVLKVLETAFACVSLSVSGAPSLPLNRR